MSQHQYSVEGEKNGKRDQRYFASQRGANDQAEHWHRIGCDVVRVIDCTDDFVIRELRKASDV